MSKERAAQIAEKDAIKYEQMVIMFLVIMFSIFLASFRKPKIDQFLENCYILYRIYTVRFLKYFYTLQILKV